MKKITKTEVKHLIKDVNYSLDNCIEFAIVDDKIKIFHFKECTNYGYCIDGFIARWKNNIDTFDECIERVHDYMCDVIEFYNKTKR